MTTRFFSILWALWVLFPMIAQAQHPVLQGSADPFFIGHFSISDFEQKPAASMLPKTSARSADTCLVDSVLSFQLSSSFDSALEYRTVNHYDALNRNIYRESSTFDSTLGIWRGDSKLIQAFHGTGALLDSIEYYNWNAGFLKLQGTYKVRNTYYANDSVHWYNYDRWDQPNDRFLPNTRTEYFYNAQNRKEKAVSENLNMTLGFWQYTIRYDYFYDASGKLMQEDRYTYTSNTWKLSSRTTYQYNASGKTQSALVQTLNTNGNWINSRKMTYDYANPQQGWTDAHAFVWVSAVTSWIDDVWIHRAFDNKDRRTEQSYYMWRNNAWEGNYSNLFAVSADEKTYEYSYWDWDTLAGTWVGSNRYVLSLNDQKQYQSEIAYRWVSLPNNWEQSGRWKYDFNTAGYTGHYSFEYYQPATGNWKFWGNTYLHYDCFVLPVFEAAAIEHILVFPNPAQNRLYIGNELPPGTEILIYASDGRLALEPGLSAGGESISIEGLAQGVYFLLLRDLNGRFGATKFVVEK